MLAVVGFDGRGGGVGSSGPVCCCCSGRGPEVFLYFFLKPEIQVCLYILNNIFFPGVGVGGGLCSV